MADDNEHPAGINDLARDIHARMAPAVREANAVLLATMVALAPQIHAALESAEQVAASMMAGFRRSLEGGRRG